MIFTKIELKNFKSFYEKHEFNFFNSKEGLMFICGENNDDKQLGANGSGKTSLINAIYWCLYGKDLRGLRATNVHSFLSKGPTEVTLSIKIFDKEYQIFRSWNPNKLFLSENGGEFIAKTQEDIENLLELSEIEFQNTVIFGQFCNSFLDLTPNQMLETFTDILKLDYWTERSDLAKEKRNNKDIELNKINNSIMYNEGQSNSIKDLICLSEKNISKFEEERLVKTEQLKNEISELKTKKLKYKVTIIDTSYLEKEIENINSDIQELGLLRQDSVEKLNYSNVYVKNIQKEILLGEKRHKEFLNEPSICPTCGQPIDSKHSTKEIKEIEKNINSKKEDLEKEVLKSVSYKEDVNAIDSEILKVRENIYNKNNDLELIRKENSKNQNTLSLLDYKITSAQDTYLKECKKVNPFIIQKKQYEEKLDFIKKTITELSENYDNIKKISSMYDGWIKGFKEIRLMIIEQAILEFEIEVNNSLLELGLHDWKISFDLEKETKSGSINRGFNVLITRPNISEQISWLSYSGGESQRLKLAVQTGLTNLILSNKTSVPNIEIYDEPSKHMNSSGVQDLAELLRNRAKNLHKQIWLVDHNPIDFGGFSETLIISKQNGKSCIIL